MLTTPAESQWCLAVIQDFKMRVWIKSEKVLVRAHFALDRMGVGTQFSPSRGVQDAQYPNSTSSQEVFQFLYGGAHRKNWNSNGCGMVFEIFLNDMIICGK